MSDENEVRDHALSRIYREGAWPEPGRQIDQAILAASRRAARERHPFLWRWAPPFAVAATVVLTSAIVLKGYREQPEALSSATMEKAETRAKQSAPQPAAEAKPAPAPAAAPAPQTAATPQGFSSTMDAGEAARMERAQQDLGLRDVLAPAAAQAKPAPANKTSPALKKEAEPQRNAETGQRRADAPQTPASGATLSVFGAQPPAAAPTAPASTQAARIVGKPATPFTQNAPQPAPSPAPAEAPAPPVAADAMKVRPETAQAAATGPGVGAIAAQADARSPQAWIDDIRKMMKDGKSEEAGQEIAKFKKRYPDYVLPEDLR